MPGMDDKSQMMDCRPKYSKVSETLRYVTSGSIQCSIFCGGKQCKYEGPAKWTENEMAIKGLYSSWATDKILAMARPSTYIIKKFNVIEQFQRWDISTIINLQHPGEHANCGYGLEESGFTYNPEDFMNNGIFFYNFIWKDYGVRSLDSVLDIVKVMDYALQNGKVAVHCHAGLGRTGVLIASYLVYSKRLSAEEAIHVVRIQRPKSVQTRAQIACVQDFAKFLKPCWIIFPECISSEPITLKIHLSRQKYILHGYEARELKFIPKIVYVVCKRLLQLCNLDSSDLEITKHSWKEKHVDEIDGEKDLINDNINNDQPISACEISASSEDIKGEFDTENVSSIDNCSSEENDLPSSIPPVNEDDKLFGVSLNESSMLNVDINNSKFIDETVSYKQSSNLCQCDETFDNIDDKLQCLDNDVPSESEELKNHESVNVRELAMLFASYDQINDENFSQVEKLKIIINDRSDGFKFVENETNIAVLVTLLLSWLQGLKHPVLSCSDVEAFLNTKEKSAKDQLLILKEYQRGTVECLMITVFKLNPIEDDLRRRVFQKVLCILTDFDLRSSFSEEFLNSCLLLCENWFVTCWR